MRLKSPAVLLLGMMLPPLEIGCQRAPEPSGALEVLVGTEPATLDPRFATRALDVKVSRLIHAGLVTLEPDTLEPKPNLARSLTRRATLEIDVELVANARFHSGTLLEPSDVCATIEAIRDPRLQSPHRSILESFARCNPTGPHSLTLTLSAPRACWMTDLEIPILRADEAGVSPKLDGQLDGLGPFRIDANTPGTLRLLPAENAFAHRPRLAVSVRTVHDENARAMRLLSGRAEVAPNAFSPSLLAGLASQTSDIVVSSRPGSNVTYLLTRCDRPPFDSAARRHGLSMAIDRKLIVHSLLADKARVAKWLIPDGHWAAPKGLPDLVFDPLKAREQLASLGPVTLLTSTDRSRILQARAIAQMLGDAGLATQVVPLELGLLLSRLDAGQFTLAILQIPELTEPNILNWFFHPRGIGAKNAQGKNRTHYDNPEVGRLLDLAAATFDADERRQQYADLARLMLSDLPVVPLWHEDQIVVARSRGRKFSLSAEGRWQALADL